MATFYTGVDQQRYDAGEKFLPMNKFLASYTAPKTNLEESQVTTSYGIPNTNAFTNSGGGGTFYPGPTSSLISGFQTAVDDRQKRLTELNRPLAEAQFPSFKGARTSDLDGDPYGRPNVKGFSANEMYNKAAAAKAAGLDTIGMFTGNMNADQAMAYADDRIQDHKMRYATGQLGPSYIPAEKPTMSRKIADMFYSIPGIDKPQSAEDILTSGYNKPYGSGGVGILGAILGRMDNYHNLPVADQAFIAQNMGYTGPTVFGENTTGGSKDPFGLNVRSAFGNYAERVGVEAEKLGDLLGGKLADKYGATFNPETGLFENEEDAAAAAKANEMTKMLRQKYGFYTNKNLEYADLVKKNAELQGIADTKIAQDFAAKNPNYGDAEKNINPGSGGGHGYDPQHDYSGTSTKDKHDRASDLGFSDIRLKENVELIGKSPSNINIYKFNYKDSPTTYQGAMAHEVPWASIKHSNGYMMVDYNKIDVNFKKI